MADLNPAESLPVFENLRGAKADDGIGIFGFFGGVFGCFDGNEFDFGRQALQLSEAGGHQIPRYGGMPSAHTAFAFSLATVIAIKEGIYSADFAIAATAVIFILDDALRMRIFLSRHGEALHKLVDRLPAAEQKDFPYLEKRLGHKTSEAIAGAVLGIVLSWIFLMVATAL